jgi:formate hydrogenlyase subunit 3/multisubunit Na+/H+ antiporter MnhD subunit
MGFYKPGANHTTDPSVARLHKAIWSLIYGGLLLLVLGLFVEKSDPATGWIMVVAGGVAAALGFVLIYVRSRIKV